MTQNLKFCPVLAIVALLCFQTFSSCRPRESSSYTNSTTEFTDKATKLIILGTNDIHGSMFPSFADSSQGEGGLLAWDATVRAIKTGRAQDSAVILVDAGDQFQGSLYSNISEGQGMMKALSTVGKSGLLDPRGGYDGMVPGNHNYDFGPVGWTKDFEENEEKNFEADLNSIEKLKLSLTTQLRSDLLPKIKPENRIAMRGSLFKAVESFGRPLLSANTYISETIQTKEGARVYVESKRCAPILNQQTIDWSKAERPEFLKSYQVVNAGGIRVAIIGMDHVDTAANTTDINVRDLCFRSIKDSYLEVLDLIESSERSRIDAYVMVVHDSAKDGSGELAKEIESIEQLAPGKLHTVIAGHTHSPDKVMIGNIPLLQSGMGLKSYSRTDFSFDVNASSERNLKLLSTNSGIKIRLDECDRQAQSFCKELPSGIEIEGQRLVPSDEMKKLLDDAKSQVDQQLRSDSIGLDETLGKSVAKLTRNFRKSSSLGRSLSDFIRTELVADVVLLHSGGIRADFPNGSNSSPKDIKYEDVFNVMPFSTDLVRLETLPARVLVDTILESVKTLNSYGVLNQSGVQVTLASGSRSSEIEKIELVRGSSASQVLYDVDRGGLVSIPNMNLNVIVSDFLLRRKSGALHLREHRGKKLGIQRDLFAKTLAKKCAEGTCYEFDDRLPDRGP